MNRKHVLRSRLDLARDVKLVGAPRPGHLVGVGQLFSVQPDVGAIVDSPEVKPESLVLPDRRNPELLPEPPRQQIRTVGGHGQVRELRSDGIAHSGQRPEVHPEKRVREGLVIDQRRHDGGGDRGRVPAACRVARLGQHFSGGIDLARSLQAPTLDEEQRAWFVAGHGLGTLGQGGEIPKQSQHQTEAAGFHERFPRNMKTRTPECERDRAQEGITRFIDTFQY